MATQPTQDDKTGWHTTSPGMRKAHHYTAGVADCTVAPPIEPRTTFEPYKWAASRTRAGCCSLCLKTLEATRTPEQRAQFEQEQAELIEQYAREDGLAEGWATTAHAVNKYHYYRPGGQSLCRYQRRAGELHYSDNPDELGTWMKCEACSLHLSRGLQPLPPVPTTPPPPRPAPGPPPAKQLDLFS